MINSLFSRLFGKPNSVFLGHGAVPPHTPELRVHNNGLVKEGKLYALWKVTEFGEIVLYFYGDNPNEASDKYFPDFKAAMGWLEANYG